MNAEPCERSRHGKPESGPNDLAAFLCRLRAQMASGERGAALPEVSNAALREVTSEEGLADRFVASARAAGVQARFLAASDWLNVVQEVLRGHGARLVVVAGQTGTALDDDRAAALVNALGATGISVSTEPNDDVLFACDAAVTGVAAAIAETGTLVCASGPRSPRGVSLIPPVHIALVDERQIVGDLFDYFARLDPTTLPANINLITGPSKTADIEGILVTGVHGPGIVHALVLAAP